MGEIAATVSYMESMSESDREKVKNYAAYIVGIHKRRQQFEPLTEDQILSILEHSDKQYHNGNFQDAEDAILQARKDRGFI